MSTRVVSHQIPRKADKPTPRGAARTNTEPAEGGFRFNAPLSQKERVLFKLALAIGAGLDAEVRAHTLRALEAGWTPEDLDYAAGLAAESFASAPLFAAAMLVKEVLNK